MIGLRLCHYLASKANEHAIYNYLAESGHFVMLNVMERGKFW
jgi:hypothetical protein